MTDTPLEWLKLVVAFASGGFAGAVFTYVISRRRQQVDFVIRITDRYLERFDELAHCKTLLSDRMQLDQPEALNLVRKTGDWFDLIGVFYDRRFLSKGLLVQVGLLEELRKFYELVTQRKNEPGSPLNDAWLWWPHFDKLVSHTRGPRGLLR